MEFYFINEGPLWIEILILFVGLLFLGLGINFLKSGESPGPWFLFGLIHFKKDKNPKLFWFFTIFWLFWGVFLLILGVIMII